MSKKGALFGLSTLLKSPEHSDQASAAEGSRKFNIVLNWLEELRQRVPVK